MRFLNLILVSFVATIYLIGNVALGYARETNIWSERHQRPSQIAAATTIDCPTLKLISLSEGGTWAPTLQGIVDAISPAQANLQTVYDSHDRTQTPVVLIQDIHMNVEAQINIAGLLQTLVNQKKIGSILIEGAFAPLPLQFFREFPDQTILSNVAKSYLDHAMLAAPSYIGVTNAGSLPVVGVDDRAHYDANVNAYLQSRSVKPAIEKTLDLLERAWNVKRNSIFSEALRRFDDARTAYHSGAMEMGAYVRRLADTTGVEAFDPGVARFLSAYTLETSLDLAAAERERKIVIEKLTARLSEFEMRELVAQGAAYRLGRIGFGAFYRRIKDLCDAKRVPLAQSPAFEKYIRYALLCDGIKTDRLLDAVEKLEQSISWRLALTPEQHRLLIQTCWLSLARKLIDFELSPNEWKTFESIDPSSWTTDQKFLPFKNFYREADVRSAFMFKALSARTETAALIVGGFHAPEIAAALKAQNRSFVMVSPRITNVDVAGGSAYLSLFAREKTPLEKLFQGEQLFVTPEAANSSAALFRIFVVAQSLVSRSASIIVLFGKAMLKARVRMPDPSNPSSADVSASAIKSVQAVFFDLDGTILERSPVIAELFGEFYWNIMSAHTPTHGWVAELTPAQRESGRLFLERTRGTMLPVQLEAMVFESGRRSDRSAVAELFQFFQERCLQEYRDKKRLPALKSGVLPLLRELKKQGIPLYVITGTAQPALAYLIDFYGLKPYFIENVGSFVPSQGSLPTKANELSRRIALNSWDPSKVVLLGDGIQDMADARSAGIVPVALSEQSSHSKAMRRSGALALFSDLSSRWILDFLRSRTNGRKLPKQIGQALHSWDADYRRQQALKQIPIRPRSGVPLFGENPDGSDAHVSYKDPALVFDGKKLAFVWDTKKQPVVPRGRARYEWSMGVEKAHRIENPNARSECGIRGSGRCLGRR